MPEYTEEQRKKLDSNIKAMIAKGATQDDVMAYAEDYKKYIQSTVTLPKQPSVTDLYNNGNQAKPVVDYKKTGDVIQTDNTNVIQPQRTAVSIEAQTKRKQFVDKAIDNAIIIKNKKYGVPEERINFDEGREQILAGLRNKDIAIDENGKIKRTAGFGESFKMTADKIHQKELDDAYLANLNREDAITYLNNKMKYPELYNKEDEAVPSGVLGALGEFGGENAAMIGKGTVGAMVGGYSAMTGGASFGTFMGMIDDAAAGGYSNALQRNYTALKSQDPNISDDEAYDKAHKAALVGEVVGIGTNALLSTTIFAKEPKFQKAADGFINGVKQSAKHTLETSPKMIGSGIAGSLINDATAKVSGVDVTLDETLKNASESAKAMAVLHFGLGVMPALVNGVRSAIPNYLRPQLENILSLAPRDEVQQFYSKAEQEGAIPQGTTEKIITKLDEFGAEKQKLDGLKLDEENKAAITGKMLQINGINNKISELEARKAAMPPALHESIDEVINTHKEEIAAIDKQIGEMQKSGKPLEQEVDNLTGEKLGVYTEMPKEPTGEELPTVTIGGKESKPETKKSGVTVKLPQVNEETNLPTIEVGKNEITIPEENTGNKQVDIAPKEEIIADAELDKNKQPTEEIQATNTVDKGSVGVGREKSDADIEKRMAEIEGAKIGTPELSEFNTLEKEMEKRERATVFNVPLEKVNDAVDTLMNKEKEQPNGYGSFIEKRDARETKEVADRYLNAKELTDAELKKDFSDAVRGNPTTWYADGLKMREALKEATNRGIDTKDMLAEVTKVYEDAGYDTKTAKSVVANMLKPIFEGSQKVNEKQIAEQPLKETTKAETKPELKTESKPKTKLQKLADKIENEGWEKAVGLPLPNLPEGTQKAGFNSKEINKALANAIRAVDKLVESGEKTYEAIQEAIEEGFKIISDYYNENTKSWNKEAVRKEYDNFFNQFYKKELENVPPIKEPPVTEKGEGGGLNDKGILNRLYNAENVPENSKKGFEKEGLKYEPQSREESAKIGKAIVDEMGIDEAVTLAEANRFKGGIRSAIFAESLNKLTEQEAAAKTPQEKLDYAKKFAEIGIRYDEFSRGSGRDISQIDYFYKKSPLGIKIMEETKRKEAFNEYAKKKDQSWKEFFDEMVKEPEFGKIFKEEVSTELKKERAAARQSRIKKVDDFFDKAKEQFKGGAAYSTIIPPQIITAALDGMKKAYHAGEKVATIIEDAISYINKELGTSWDTEKFKKEWEEKLGERKKKSPEELSEEKRIKILDKFRNKLKGLTEKEKDEVIRKSFKKLVDNGALEYEDFKKIIAETLGYGELTPEQSAKIAELVGQINVVDGMAETLRNTTRTEQGLKDYLAAKKKADEAGKILGKMLWSKPDIIQRLLSIMQLNTLTIPSLVNNPVFNVINQASVRAPRSAIMTGIDYAIYGAGKMFGKDYKPTNNIVLAQKEFYPKLAQGLKQSGSQLVTGLTNRDYFQKEVYASQIHPLSAMLDLWDFKQGKLNLTKAQVADKTLQATLGVPAEIIARFLNMGDKPQRFASEGGQAATFAKNLGLQNIDYKLFMEFPKEEAFRAFKKEGLSDELATKKAQDVYDRIIKEGEESVFQEDNLLNDAITAAFKPFGKAGAVVKTLNMPFVKIPLNAMWSIFNLVNPEVALTQSAIYGYKAIKSKSAIDIQNSKKWFAHAVTGMAWGAALGALAKSGIINSPNEGDVTKKERQGEDYYEQQNSINISKLNALLQGKNPDDVKNGLNIDLKWLGNLGVMMSYQKTKLDNLTPEQKEKGLSYMEDMMANLKVSTLDFMDNGVFSNTGALFSAIQSGGVFMDAYLLNLMNMGTNIVQPAALAQISRAQLPYYSTVKSDSFLKEIKNNMLTRSSVLRKVMNEMPPSKINIWGEPLARKDDAAMRLFSMSRSGDDNFAQPLYDDYKKTNDTRFFPSAVKPEIREDKQTVKIPPEYAAKLEEMVGKARKQLVAPYINDMAVFEGSTQKYSEIKEPENKIAKLQILYNQGYDNGKTEFLKAYPQFNVKPKTDEEKQKAVIQSKLNNALSTAVKNKPTNQK